jgi:hypothetical protein
VKHPLLAALAVPTVIVIILGVQGLIMGVIEIIGGFKGGGIGSLVANHRGSLASQCDEKNGEYNGEEKGQESK